MDFESPYRADEGIQFQSPKSGKFESNITLQLLINDAVIISFNPLNRGNLNQINALTRSKVILLTGVSIP